MNKFTEILIRLGILKLSTDRIEQWAAKGCIDAIEFSLEHGMFSVREKAALELGKLKSKSSVPVLVQAMDDNIKIVSLAAMSAIEAIDSAGDFRDKIEAKRAYWAKLEVQKKQKKSKRKAPSTRKWERKSKQTFDNMKQMLKKPMIGGKWF